MAVHALQEAEEHASGYYCIPPHRWKDFPYDLLTKRDREWNPLPEGVFAETRRVEHQIPRAGMQHEFYRIQLNDPAILKALERERLQTELYPFLVFVLTHEMVHLVRLSSILESDHVARLERDPEEARVGRISRQILQASSPNRFRSVLDRFQPHGDVIV